MGNCVPNPLGNERTEQLKMHEQELAATSETAEHLHTTDLRKSDKAIMRHMKSSDLESTSTHKYLLLGAGSCGKSTLFKQLKCIYGTGFVERDMLFANMAIRYNCVQSMLTLLRKSMELYELDKEEHAVCNIELNTSPHLLPMIELVISYQRYTLQQYAIMDPPEGNHEEMKAVGRAISSLWALDAIQETYKRRALFFITANMDYFLSKATSVFSPTFKSSHEDYLKSRITTTAISDAVYSVDGQRLHVVNVGGQRSERKKWIHLFDGISSVIFVAALDHYSSMLFEDESKNALEESLELLDELVNSKWFRRSHIILYLNKFDLFLKEIRSGKSIRTLFNPTTYRPKNPEYFEEYLGPEYVPTGNVEADEKLLQEVAAASCEFILNQFLKRNHYPERTFSIHKSLTATDELQVKQAFWDVLNTFSTKPFARFDFS